MAQTPQRQPTVGRGGPEGGTDGLGGRLRASLAAAAAGEIGCGNCKACSCASPTATRTLSLVVLVASIPINRGRKSLAFTRMGDILQSFCCTWSLPFALCGMGVVTLVRTGGIP